MFKLKAQIGIIIFIISMFSLKIYELSNKLENSEKEIELLTSKLEACNTSLMYKKSIIEQQNNSLEDLNKHIDTLNAKYSRYKKDYETAKANLELWQNKDPVVKYKYIYKTIVPKNANLNNENCEMGLEINRRVAKLKYKDL